MCEKYRAKEHYINNRDVILNRAKEYYINNKEAIKEQKYRKNMTDEGKQKMKDYQREYRKNITDERKQRYKENRNKRYKDKYYNMTD